MAKKKVAKKRATKAQPATSAKPAVTRERSLASLPAFEQIEKLFEQFLSRRWPRLTTADRPKWADFDWPELAKLAGSPMPSVDITEDGGNLVVRAEVPGVKKKDLNVTISERMLTIKGHSHSESERKLEDGDGHQREIRRGAFSRTLLLPSDVDAGKATATCRDGVLELVLPKRAGARETTVTLK